MRQEVEEEITDSEVTFNKRVCKKRDEEKERQKRKVRKGEGQKKGR